VVKIATHYVLNWFHLFSGWNFILLQQMLKKFRQKKATPKCGF
jgi:hypothetical protein